MGAINTSRSNIKNTSSVPGGVLEIQVDTDFKDDNGQITIQGVFNIKFNDKNIVKQEFRTEGKRT